MRVAVYHNLPSGGAKRALREIIKRTSGHYQYDLYTIQSDDDFFGITEGVQNIYSFPFEPGKSQSAFARVGARKRLVQTQKTIAREIDSHGYDFVFVSSCKTEHSPSILRFLKTKTVYYMQEPRRASFEYNLSPYRPNDNKGLIANLKNAIGYLLNERPLLRQDMMSAKSASMIMCNSLFSLEAIARAYGVYAQPCYLGIDTTAFAPSSKNGIKKGFISVGALHPNKGHELIIRAVGALAESDRDLNIVYDREFPGHMENLRSIAEQRGVRLHFRNRIKDSELAGLYSSAKLTVCAAELEPFGFTPLESLACGTPVAAVNEGGYRETINSNVGALSARSETELAESISALLKSSLTSSELRSYVLNNWSWDLTVERYLELTRGLS